MFYRHLAIYVGLMERSRSSYIYSYHFYIEQIRNDAMLLFINMQFNSNGSNKHNFKQQVEWKLLSRTSIRRSLVTARNHERQQYSRRQNSRRLWNVFFPLIGIVTLFSQCTSKLSVYIRTNACSMDKNFVYLLVTVAYTCATFLHVYHVRDGRNSTDNQGK